jgi:hypothetical protein
VPKDNDEFILLRIFDFLGPGKYHCYLLEMSPLINCRGGNFLIDNISVGPGRCPLNIRY